MTHRERVRLSLQHRQPDVVPYHIGFTQRAYRSLQTYLGDSPDFLMVNNALAQVGVGGAGMRQVAPDVWEDSFGVLWNRSIDPDIGTVCNERVSPISLDQYEFPEPAGMDALAHVCATDRDHFIVADLGFSLFERAWTLTGMENLLSWMVERPDFVHALLDRILEFNLSVVDAACIYPIDAMMFGDDWGQQTGLIMGPRLWREFIGPRVGQMYGRVKAHGKFVVIHSCGKVDSLFSDLIELGLDLFNPFQPEVMDVVEMKHRYGSRLSFFGGISTQKTLPYGTPQQVKDEVRRLLDVVGKDGGLVAAPAHAIPADARPENILAMFEVLNGQ